MNIFISHQAKRLVYFLSLTGLLWGERMLPALAQSNHTEIREIQRDRRGNITKISEVDRDRLENVLRHRSEWEVAHPDDELASGNWLATGSDSMAWIWYGDIGVIYRQYADTMSQFVPGTRCGFRVRSGSNLFLDRGRVPGCSQIAGNVQVNLAESSNEPVELTQSGAYGYVVHRNPSVGSTVIAAIASENQQSLLVSSLDQNFVGSDGKSIGDSIQLQPGEFALVLDNGVLTKGEFSLSNFYANNPLALGLGDSSEDQEYIEELESLEDKDLFEEIRTVALSATREQSRPGAFELRGFRSIHLPELFPSSPGCSLPIDLDGGEGAAEIGCLN
ncbi:MAG: hypothetical protein AAF716_11055 [Cyanobacteria bacterium P01_D01_bin.1]